MTKLILDGQCVGHLARFVTSVIAFPFVVVMLCLGLGTRPAFCDSFETRLSPSPLTDGIRINIVGEGRATASLDGSRLTVSGDFHGFASAATSAQIFDGLGIGIPGTEAFDLTVTPATNGMIVGSFILSARQVANIRKGRFYVQINSAKAPDGNLFGWLLSPHPFAGEDVPVQGHGFLPQLDVR